MSCVFCELPSDRLVAQSDHALTIRDAFPVTQGHTLVLPRRHVERYFDCTPAEKEALWSMVEDAKAGLDAELHPDGYNVGINVGRAAGQTVMHAHIHLVPRYAGDTADPAGGVRGVIPGKQRYG